MSRLTEVFNRVAEAGRAFPIIKERWYVLRFWDEPAQSDDWHLEACNKVVSPYFDTRSEAEQWLNDNRRTFESGTLVIQTQKLRRFTEDRWVSW